METFVHKVLSINLNLQELNNRIEVLQSKDSHRFETLIGVCARLSLVDQIRKITSNAITPSDRQEIIYQIDRTSVYLTTTCIDVLTGGHYQQYDQWLVESYNHCTLGENWDSAIDELSKSQTPFDTANSFLKWTIKMHNSDYMETMSIRKAFKQFICTADDWMKKWLYQNYVVIELKSDFKPKIYWEDLSNDKKCKNIANYLYSVRNLYTHTVTPYQPLDNVQRHLNSLPENLRPMGFMAILFPPVDHDPARQIALPGDKLESDVIRMLIIRWIRNNWLEITDNESFIQEYWKNREEVNTDLYIM